MHICCIKHYISYCSLILQASCCSNSCKTFQWSLVTHKAGSQFCKNKVCEGNKSMLWYETDGVTHLRALVSAAELMWPDMSGCTEWTVWMWPLIWGLLGWFFCPSCGSGTPAWLSSWYKIHRTRCGHVGGLSASSKGNKSQISQCVNNLLLA